MPHIVATISAHGFGHLSISAPVLNELHRRLPNLELTIISGLARQRIRSRITVPFHYEYSALDFGVHMDRGLSVTVHDTVSAYRSLHDNWTKQVEDYADKLKRLNCSLVLSNVSYLSLAAAKYLGVPGVALSPLNWGDMYNYYCHQANDYARIHRQILAAYGSAQVFLKPVPCMPMHDLSNTKQIEPVAARGNSIRYELLHRLGLGSSTRLVLVAMGGHDMPLPVSWPTDHTVWLVTRAWQAAQPNVITFDDLNLPFLDLLASCDLLMSKPGYGSFVEATYMRKPILYLTRPDWPEECFLIQWLQRHNACKHLSPESLCDGTLIEAVDELLQPGLPPAQSLSSPPLGVAQAVDVILNKLM